jgi:hypothetical protein
MIYFNISPQQVEPKVLEEYEKYYSDKMSLAELNALMLAAYAKVTKLTLYPGVLDHVSEDEESEVKSKMILTISEYEKTNKMIDRLFYADREMKLEINEELLKIQQEKALANLKYMGWETRVNESELLKFWHEMSDPRVLEIPTNSIFNFSGSEKNELRTNKYFVNSGFGSG